MDRLSLSLVVWPCCVLKSQVFKEVGLEDLGSKKGGCSLSLKVSWSSEIHFRMAFESLIFSDEVRASLAVLKPCDDEGATAYHVPHTERKMSLWFKLSYSEYFLCSHP